MGKNAMMTLLMKTSDFKWERRLCGRRVPFCHLPSVLATNRFEWFSHLDPPNGTEHVNLGQISSFRTQWRNGESKKRYKRHKMWKNDKNIGANGFLICRQVILNWPRSLWQYGLWSFQTGGKKLERFLPKNQHTQTKNLNFENWTSGEPQ